jgi:hypothetical protein
LHPTTEWWFHIGRILRASFLYVSAVSDMIDIKDGTNAHCQSSSSFQHKECPLGHSVGASWHWVPHDDDGKDIILVLIVSQIFA